MGLAGLLSKPAFLGGQARPTKANESDPGSVCAKWRRVAPLALRKQARREEPATMSATSFCSRASNNQSREVYTPVTGSGSANPASGLALQTRMLARWPSLMLRWQGIVSGRGRGRQRASLPRIHWMRAKRTSKEQGHYQRANGSALPVDHEHLTVPRNRRHARWLSRGEGGGKRGGRVEGRALVAPQKSSKKKRLDHQATGTRQQTTRAKGTSW